MIVIEPKFNLGDEDVYFIGQQAVSYGKVVAINYCEIDNALPEYNKRKIRGISYGIKVLVDYFGNKYEVIDVPESQLFESEIALAQHLLNKAQR